MPSKDAALAGLQFDDDATNNRTDVMRAGTRVMRLAPGASIFTGSLVGDVTGDVTGDLTQGSVIHRTANVTITATQLRTLRATPVAIVAGVTGKVLIFRGMLVKYNGTTVFDSVGAGEDLAVRLVDDSGPLVSASLDTTTDINFGATDDVAAWVPPLATVVALAATYENEPLVLHNVGGGELATTDDNSDGNATLDLVISYLEVTV